MELGVASAGGLWDTERDDSEACGTQFFGGRVRGAGVRESAADRARPDGLGLRFEGDASYAYTLAGMSSMILART
jgi:hypothetical protein